MQRSSSAPSHGQQHPGTSPESLSPQVPTTPITSQSSSSHATPVPQLPAKRPFEAMVTLVLDKGIISLAPNGELEEDMSWTRRFYDCYLSSDHRFLVTKNHRTPTPPSQMVMAAARIVVTTQGSSRERSSSNLIAKSRGGSYSSFRGNSSSSMWSPRSRKLSLGSSGIQSSPSRLSRSRKFWHLPSFARESFVREQCTGTKREDKAL